MVALGIALASIASFVLSAALYALPPVSAQIARTSTPRPGLPVAAQMGSVLIRGIVASALIAGLMLVADWHGAGIGALLGASLSVLPAVLLSGAVVHENTPVPTAAVHLLDWAAKLVVSGAIVGAFL